VPNELEFGFEEAEEGVAAERDELAGEGMGAEAIGAVAGAAPARDEPRSRTTRVTTALARMSRGPVTRSPTEADTKEGFLIRPGFREARPRVPSRPTEAAGRAGHLDRS